MAIQESERLRQLVSDYYHGLITAESYRDRRAILLDNIGADTDEQADTVSRGQSPAEQRREPPPSLITDEATAESGFRPKWLLTGAIVLAVVAAGAFVIFSQLSGPAPEPAAAQGEIIAGSGSERGDALVEDFLERDDWTTDSLNNFLLAWGGLDAGQRQRSTEGRLYRRLRIRLHQRIREEEVLSSDDIGSGFEALTDFATKIGAPFRESQAAAFDDAVATETPPDVDMRDEPGVLSTQGDDTPPVIVPVESEGPVTVPVESEEPVIVPVANKKDVPDSVPEPVAEISEPDDPVDDSATSAKPATNTSAVRPAPTSDPCPARIANTRRPYCQDTLMDGSKGPPLVVLPTGAYEMGTDGIDSESPPHQVDIAYHLAFSRYEITAQEFQQYCAATSLICAEAPWGDDYPIVSVSWDDAVAYTEWLSETTGFEYRLPSEAEWEFAARAGTESPYFFGDEITPSAAHWSGNGTVDSPVSRSDQAVNRNPFRLYHMSGNVREWTQDAWIKNYDNSPRDGSAHQNEAEDRRVVRGGSYSDSSSRLRSAAREPLDRSHRDSKTGIRVVREVR